MGRKAKFVNELEFKETIIKKMNKYYTELVFDFEEGFNFYDILFAFPKIQKDLEKVEFDFENYEAQKDEKDADSLIGINTVGDITFLGIEAGGDWETPVFFIIYIDNKNQVRGYVPTNGNTINSRTKAAFGNAEDDEDELEAKSLGYKHYDDIEKDWKKIKDDIENRITIV